MVRVVRTPQGFHDLLMESTYTPVTKMVTSKKEKEKRKEEQTHDTPTPKPAIKSTTIGRTI